MAKGKNAPVNVEQKKIGQFSGIVFPRKGGLEGFEETVGSFNDSSPFNFHKSTTRVTKSGENAGRVYFVGPRLSEGKNGCFTMDEAVALELDNPNLGLVGGDVVEVDGRKGIKDPFLNIAREVVGQKVKGVLKLVE